MLRDLKKTWRAVFLFTVTQTVCLAIYAEHPIFTAIERGDVSKVKRIIGSASEKWKTITNQYGWSALYSAVGKGDVEIVRQLLEGGSDPNFVSVVSVRPEALRTKELVEPYEEKDTPLLALVEKSGINESDLAIVDLLLRFGADFQVNNSGGVQLINIIKRKLGFCDGLKKSERRPICDFTRSQFNHILTNNGGEEFELIKKTWPIFADGVSFASLVRSTLEKAMDQSIHDVFYGSIFQILQNPEPWLFSGLFPSDENLGAMLNDLEKVLKPIDFFRLSFAMQQKNYESLKSKGKTVATKCHRSKNLRLSRAFRSSGELTQLPKRDARPEDRYRLPQEVKNRKGDKRIAEHIFALDRDKFLAISPEQFIQGTLNLQHWEGYGQQIACSIGLKTLVVSTILLDCRTSEKNGCETYNFWVGIAERLFTNRDLIGLEHVVAALKDRIIKRLKLPKKERRKIPSEIAELISSKKRYANYRVKKADFIKDEIPFIPMCNVEANDLAVGAEVSSNVLRGRGVKVFNFEKNSTFIEFLSTWAKIQKALSATKQEETDDIRRWLHESLQLPEEYPEFLSFLIKPCTSALDMPSNPRILPLWGPTEFENFYCVNLARLKRAEDDGEAYNTFADTIEYAMLSGLCRGIPLFYEYLKWKSNHDHAALKSKEKRHLFSSIEACFPIDIMDTIREFESKEEDFNIDYQSEAEAPVGLEQQQLAKEKAIQRWIIYLVKNNCSCLILPFKEKGVVDSGSYLRVFSRCFKNGELICADFNKEFEALKAKENDKVESESLQKLLEELYKRQKSRED